MFTPLLWKSFTKRVEDQDKQHSHNIEPLHTAGAFRAYSRLTTFARIAFFVSLGVFVWYISGFLSMLEASFGENIASVAHLVVFLVFIAPALLLTLVNPLYPLQRGQGRDKNTIAMDIRNGE